MNSETFDAVLDLLARCVPRGSRRGLAESFPGVIDEFAPRLPEAERSGLAGVCTELSTRVAVSPEQAREDVRKVLAELNAYHPEFVHVLARRLGGDELDLPAADGRGL